MKGSFEIDGISYSTTEFGELHLWNFTQFVEKVSKGQADQASWNASASLLAWIIPELKDKNLVVFDNTTNSGNIFLSIDQLQQVFNGLKVIWESGITSKTQTVESNMSNQHDEIELLKLRIKELEG